jgi:hypothetical protein
VQRVRRETGRAVPDIDPNGPGTDARVVIILNDPGKSGALTTKVLSINNPDRTAHNQQALFAEARLDSSICLFWNAIPWHLGAPSRNPNRADKDRGAVYLADLLGLFDQEPVVVACGRHAHQVCDILGIDDAIRICHPGDQALNRDPANRANHVKGLREASQRVSNRRQ